MDPSSALPSTICRLGRGRSSADDLQGLVRWLRQARALGGLAGGLLFDGEAWQLLMQGPSDNVQDLLRRLAHADVGGHAIELHAATPVAGLAGWRVGYVEPGQLDVAWAGGAPSVDARRDRLLALLDGSDAA